MNESNQSPEKREDRRSARKASHNARHSTRRRFRSFLGAVEWRTGSVRNWLVRCVAPPFQFVTDWFMTRDWRGMCWGLLPLVVSVTFILFVVAGLRIPKSELIAGYRSAAAAEFENGNTEAAKLWMEKASWLDDDGPETQYGLAITAAKLGNDERAREIMEKLAPDNGRGYGPAHVWVAAKLMQSKEPLDESRAGLIRHHLTEALVNEPGNRALRQQLGLLEFSQRNLPAAIEQFTTLSAADQRFSLSLAELHALNSDPDRARETAASAIRHFETQVEKDPANVEPRIIQAQLEAFLEDFQQAEKTLSSGLLQKDIEPENLNRLRIALGNVYVVWAANVQQTKPEDTALRLQLLEQALRFAPGNSRVLEMLATLSREDSEHGQAGYEALNDILADGRATPTVHLILGMASYDRGDVEEAARHWRLSLDGNPQHVIAANNLAWTLAHNDPPQLDMALELVEKAVSQVPVTSPYYPEIRATRGTIFQLLGRNEEAIVEFEFALAKLDNRPNIHESLAELYETVGNEDLASRHRQRAAANTE